LAYNRKLIISGFAGQLPLILQFVSGLVLFPIMISYFGNTLFGIWVLLSTITGYFGLLDLGFSKASQRFVSRAIGKNDLIEANSWNNIGLFLIGITTAIGFVIFAILFFNLGLIVNENIDIIRPAFLVAGISFLIALPSRLFIGILQAHLRSDIYDVIFAIASIISIISFFTAIYLEFNFVCFILISSVINVLQAVFVVIYAIKVNGKISFDKLAFVRRNISEFADYSFSSFIADLADMFRFQLYPIIISFILGVAAITTFQIANKVRTIVSSIIIKSLINLTAYFSQIEGRLGIGEELTRAYLFSYKISIFLTVMVTGLTAAVAQPFIYRWVGEDYQMSVSLLLIMLVGNFVSGIHMPATCFLFGTSKHRFYAVSNSIEAIMIIVSAIILAESFGLIGMVIGATASTVIIKTFVQPVWALRVLKLSIGKFLLQVLGRNLLFSFSIFSVLYYVLNNLFLGPTFFEILLFSILITPLYLFCVYYLVFNSSERTGIKRMVRG
jgi:O-antigen/teichoic acid export membrane protein